MLADHPRDQRRGGFCAGIGGGGALGAAIGGGPRRASAPSLWAMELSDNAALAVVPVTATVSGSRRPRYRLGQHVTPRAHRLAARRAGVLMQTPFTRCMPGPHASRTLITTSSGCCRGAPRGMACTDDAKVRAKAIAINLSIASLSCLLESANARRFLLLAKPTGAAREAPVIDLDQATAERPQRASCIVH